VGTDKSEQQEGRPLQAALGYLFAALAAAGWASGGIIAKWLMTEPSAATAEWLVEPLGVPISAEVLSADRALLAGVISMVVILIRYPQELKISPKGWGQFALYGVFGLACLHFTYYAAIDLISASTAVLIQYLAPVLVMLFSVIVLRELPTWRLPVGIALALFGATLVTGALSFGEQVVSAEGLALALASAVFFALFSLMGNFLGSRYRSTVVMAFGMCFAAAFWLIVLGPQRVLQPFTVPPVALTLLVTVILSTIFATLTFLKALKYIKTANATMTCILEPFLVALGELVLFHETLTPVQLIGGLLIVIAVLVALSADLAKARQ
jgi:drug/metabolite transporter (DMT)-like permease